MRVLTYWLLLLFVAGCGVKTTTQLSGPLTLEAESADESEAAPTDTSNGAATTDTTEEEMAVPNENSLDDVLKMVQDGSAILVDVRSDEEWDEHHFKAAKHIPIDKINEDAAGALAEVKKEQLVFLH